MPNPKTKISYGDGMRYEFTPGKNGSLIAQKLQKSTPTPLFLDRDPNQPRAKVIGPNQTDPLGEMKILLARNKR